jgi:hypothetical protein
LCLFLKFPTHNGLKFALLAVKITTTSSTSTSTSTSTSASASASACCTTILVVNGKGHNILDAEQQGAHKEGCFKVNDE